jgi:hypothetical protein
MPQRINNPDQPSFLIEAQATYYRNMVQIYVPRLPILSTGNSGREKQAPFLGDDELAYLELSNHFDALTGVKISKSDNETTKERSLRRAKKRIGDYILSNDFDIFATFTMDSEHGNREDNEASRKKLIGWLKNQRNRNGKFRYIVVPEFHGDKKSLHFHALIGGYAGKVEQAINSKTGKPLVQKGKATYQIPGYTLGYTNVKIIGSKPEDQSRLSAYLKKYITKDMPTFTNKQRYWVSKHLELPLIENNPEQWYHHVEPDWWCEFENGTLLRFDLNKHPLTNIFWEANGRAKL